MAEELEADPNVSEVSKQSEASTDEPTSIVEPS
jgi:hypothetical protein